MPHNNDFAQDDANDRDLMRLLHTGERPSPTAAPPSFWPRVMGRIDTLIETKQEQRNVLGLFHEGWMLWLPALPIVIVIVALVAPRYIGGVHSAKQDAATAQIENLAAALDMFRFDVGRYPTTQEGLQALRQRPAGLERWNGPYLKKEVPRDPWGNAYFYRSLDQNETYEIISYGADGMAGGSGENADQSSWEDR